METPDAFEQIMAKTIWETRWKNHSAFDTWLRHHPLFRMGPFPSREV